MIVSLNKNKWLYEWMHDRWRDDNFQFMNYLSQDQKFTLSKKLLGNFLESKGYAAKVTSTEDLLISMKEEEFVFLKLKYS